MGRATRQERMLPLVEALVRRACMHHAYGHLAAAGASHPAGGGRSRSTPGPSSSAGFAITEQQAHALVPQLLELARYRAPAKLHLPDDSDNRRFAVAANYWRGKHLVDCRALASPRNGTHATACVLLCSLAGPGCAGLSGARDAWRAIVAALPDRPHAHGDGGHPHLPVSAAAPSRGRRGLLCQRTRARAPGDRRRRRYGCVRIKYREHNGGTQAHADRGWCVGCRTSSV